MGKELEFSNLADLVLLSDDLLASIMEALGMTKFYVAAAVCHTWKRAVKAKLHEWRAVSHVEPLSLTGVHGGFIRPTYIARLPNGNFCVADSHLQVVSPDGCMLGRMAGSLTVGDCRPWGLVCDGTSIFVALASSSGGGQLLQLALDGNLLCAAPLGSSPLTGRVRYPDGLALAASGLFMVDTRNDEVVAFDTVTLSVHNSFGGTGSAIGQLRYPLGIAAWGDELFVAERDNNRVQVFALEGGPRRLIGAAGAGPGRFYLPRGVAVTCGSSLNQPRLFVSEACCVQVLTLSGKPLQMFEFYGACMYFRMLSARQCALGLDSRRGHLHGLLADGPKMYVVDEGFQTLHVLKLCI